MVGTKLPKKGATHVQWFYVYDEILLSYYPALFDHILLADKELSLIIIARSRLSRTIDRGLRGLRGHWQSIVGENHQRTAAADAAPVNTKARSRDMYALPMYATELCAGFCKLCLCGLHFGGFRIIHGT